MIAEQKLSRFILGLEGQLAKEVNSLRHVSLADALIRAKAKLKSFITRDCKRPNPFPPTEPFRPPKVNPLAQPKGRPSIPHFVGPRPFVQPVRVNALPINQSGRQIQCHKCYEWGHKKADCPSNTPGQANPRLVLPSQREAYQNCNNGQPKKQNYSQSQKVTINFVSIRDEINEQAQIYAALDPSRYNCQSSILEAQGIYEEGIPDGTGTNFGYEGEATAPPDNQGCSGTIEGISY